MELLYRRLSVFTGLPLSFLVWAIMLNSTTILAEPRIQIVTENTYPWTYYDESNGKLKGFSTELITAIMKEANLNFEITVLPWPRAFRRVKNDKNTLIYSMGRTAERENQFIWIGKIFNINNSVYGLKKDNKKIIKDISELKNCITGVVRNDIFNQYFEDHGFQHVIQLESYEQILQLLKRGRIQCYGSSKIGADYFFERNNIDTNSVVPIFTIDDLNTDIYFAANIDTNAGIIKKIKESFLRIKENGTYLKIMQPMFDGQKN